MSSDLNHNENVPPVQDGTPAQNSEPVQDGTPAQDDTPAHNGALVPIDVPAEQKTPEFWAKEIQTAYQQTVQCYIRTGALLIGAKDRLLHGDFEKMVKRDLPFSKRKAEMLMKIARHLALVNPKHFSVLPPYWSTLHELTRLPPQILLEKIQDGTIHPKFMRKKVVDLLPKPEAEEDEDEQEADVEQEADLEQEADEQEAEHEAEQDPEADEQDAEQKPLSKKQAALMAEEMLDRMENDLLRLEKACAKLDAEDVVRALLEAVGKARNQFDEIGSG